MSNARTMEVEYTEIPWWLVLIQGIAAIILGILLFVRPTYTIIILIQFLGVYWLITGIFSIVSLTWDRSQWGWKVTSGILGILAGILIIKNPLWSTLFVPATLALLLGGIGVLIGIFQLIDAFRSSGIGVGILGGFNIILGFILITRPVIAGFALSWILAGVLIVGGILAIIAAFGTRYLDNLIKEASMQPANHAAVVPTGQAEAAVMDVSDTVDYIAMDTDLEYKWASEADFDSAAVVDTVGEEAVEEVASTLEEASEVMGGVVDDLEVAEASIEEIEEVDVVIETSDVILTGNVDPTDPTEMEKFKYSLEYVEGIGPVYGEQLNAIGIVNCLDLLEAGATRKGREEIAEKSGISGKLILKWVNHVDLYRIKGVGSEYSDLLEKSGVDTVVELAQRNPTNLFEKLVEVNTEKNLVRQIPTQTQVEDWVSQAKGLPRVVQY